MKRVLVPIASGLCQRTTPHWSLLSGASRSLSHTNSPPSAEDDYQHYSQRVGDKLHQLAASNLFPEAISLVDRLMISGYDKEAEEVANFMRDGGIPEVVTSIHKIKCLCKQSDFEEAKLVLPQMQKYGFGSNEYAHLVLIEELINGGELDDAISFFENMSRDGVISSASAYDFMILKTCEKISLDYIVDLGYQMLEHGYKPRLNTIATMFYTLRKGQRLVEAEQLVMKMKEKGAFYFDESLIKGEFLAEDSTTELVMSTLFGKST